MAMSDISSFQYRTWSGKSSLKPGLTSRPVSPAGPAPLPYRGMGGYTISSFGEVINVTHVAMSDRISPASMAGTWLFHLHLLSPEER